MFFKIFKFNVFFLIHLVYLVTQSYSNDILGCGGFVNSHASLDFSKIEIGLYTKEGSLKEKTECAPTNGYYFLPLYEKGEYILKVHPPAGWSFEPSEVELVINGETDQCSTGEDINFAFNGFGITGKVITAGLKNGPGSINIQLISEKGDIRNTVTSVGGDFHFTPVIPGRYVLKASHPRWKLEPSQTVVQVKEGNTALPVGALSVKGYDVSGSVTSFGSPISGIYVLLYSIEASPKFRVEGCKTALLQGVPDSPICYSLTNSAGEFKFGLVPAGEYKFLALSKSPGEAFLTYNIKQDTLPFNVQHDSLYIKNAFEINGFTTVGTVLTGPGGSGISGARVLMNEQPIGSTDAAGKFTLTSLKPGTYTLNFQHGQCEFDELQVVVSASGVAAPIRAVAARWRVCGDLSPSEPRRLALRGADRAATELHVQAGADGIWCTFLPPGVYTVKVEVSEQEQRDGLQFYPEVQRVTVGRGAVSGVSFGQVRARVRGRAVCGRRCAGVRVALRPLAADGTYAGPPRYAPVVDGEYVFEEVVPGSVEVSVGSEKLCWAEAAHNVAVTQELPPVPDFELRGLALALSATHRMEVEYKSEVASGILTVPAGASRHCLPLADTYTLTPKGCHLVEPPEITVDMYTEDVPNASFVAKAHAVLVRVHSAERAADLALRTGEDGGAGVVPLRPLRRDGHYEYEHTLYLAEGEVAVVTPQSSSLLFTPRGSQKLVGGADCQPQALTFQAAKALILAGRIVPPVTDALITLEGEDIKITQNTKEDGAYSFGPLDASLQYRVTAEKESYVFTEREPNGDIRAHKLAEIEIELLDDADGAPLEGALVSVSGGAFRRNVATGPSGALRFGALAPAQYYVKPNMKEYRFEPPHAIVPVDDGRTHRLVFKGVRVAWSLRGRAVSLGGMGIPGVPLRARAASPEHAVRCSQQDATTAATGDFRIRGLLPGCTYVVELKESSDPELVGMELAKAPPPFEVTERDISDVRLIAVRPERLTDTDVLVRAPDVDHYRSLRLTLAPEATPHSPVFSAKLDPAGYGRHNNPGLMYAMPRLPADDRPYVLRLESSLSKQTHSYEERAFYFNSDGKFRSFEIDFEPKVKSSEQELRQSSLLALPLLAVLGLLYTQRHRLPNLRPDAVKKAPRKKTQ